jgi:hypothetical protein
VVIISAFPRSKSGIFDLILEKIPSFRSDTNELFCFLYFHSIFDVGRSMFDVHFFQSVLGKNNLALIGGTGA